MKICVFIDVRISGRKVSLPVGLSVQGPYSMQKGTVRKGGSHKQEQTGEQM